MINNIQEFFKITATLVIGSILLWSCESDADQLGSQFFQNGAEGIEAFHDVIAYNSLNGDTIRTDADRLQNATLGAFDESQFGLQKSAYVTQARLSSYEPDFGANAALDSAVLVIKPLYPADSIVTTTNEDYIYPVGAVPAKLVKNSFPISKYGKTKINGKTILNIKVHEVDEFLGANTEKVMSNKNVATGIELGSKAFDGTINSVKITKDSDNSTLFENNVALRIKLDSTYFSNKIIKKAKTAAEFADAASFIRYFKGIKLSVVENDGYIFNFNPNDVVINLYYKNDKVDGSVTTREEKSFALNLGGGNVHFNQINFDRAGTPAATLVQDTLTGSPKVFAQGMGGPGIGLKVPDATIASIKDLYNSNKIGIISAKIRIYTDETSWSNKYAKPSYFVVKQKGLNTFLTDMTDLALTGVYKLVKPYDLDKNQAHYDIGVTQTIKNIIEKELNKPAHFIINVGNYTTDSEGALFGFRFPKNAQNYNSRSFTPNRAVFIGSEAGNAKRAQLILTYGKK